MLYRLVGQGVYMENVERKAELREKIQQQNPFSDPLIDQWWGESLALFQRNAEFPNDDWMNHMVEDL